jgi:hypothetical protein
MPVTRKTISVAWLAENNACNLEVCRQYFSKLAGEGFTDQTEFDLTPEGILKASQGRVLSTNWLASRILDGPERKEFEREQKIALDLYERRMAPVLAAIVARDKQKPPA